LAFAFALLTISVRSAEPLTPRQIEAHRSDIFSLSFSPDGKRLASASKDRLVKIWNAQTGEEIRTLKGHEADVLRVAFSPDGKTIASAAADGTLRLWDSETGEIRHKIKAHGGMVCDVSFSRDG